MKRRRRIVGLVLVTFFVISSVTNILGAIIPNIITKMSLPATSPDGQPMSYALDHKEGGRRLLESWTLVEAGIQNGDHLIVYPEVVAGRV